MQVLIHRDSSAWSLPVWHSILPAIFLCGEGPAWLQRAPLALNHCR